MSKDKIDGNLSLNFSNDLTAEVSQKSLKAYSDGFDIASKLEGDLPIFLDTNILLGYYGMSQAEKVKLVQFVKTFKTRIRLTRQIEEEYLRNRLSVINKDFFSPLDRISDDFSTLRSEILHKFQSFTESKKRILSNDYPSLWAEIKKLEEEIRVIIDHEELHISLQKEIATTTSNNKNILYKDELLELVASLIILPALTVEELNHLAALFSTLLNQYQEAKDNVRWRYSIPGCGEYKEDAMGDFIIFHEVLKFMKNENKSVILLTNDVTKGDWLRLDRNPHIHYIEQTYQKTKNVMFIIHAEKTLTDISFENIHKSQEQAINDSASKESMFESNIVKIDHEKGYGFIMASTNWNDNVYFNKIDAGDDFFDLESGDLVRYKRFLNDEKKFIAKNVSKIKYSFDGSSGDILKSRISHINYNRKIGHVFHSPENLYFHQAFLENSKEFEDLKLGQEVEFKIGWNSEGEQIARIIRASATVSGDQPED